MSDIVLESSPAAAHPRNPARKSLASAAFGVSAGLALRLLMLSVLLRLVRSPPGHLH